MLSKGGSMGGLAGGSGHRGGVPWGQWTFWSSCHVLHCHMVLRPEGTSHNHDTGWQWKEAKNDKRFGLVFLL